MKAYCMCRQPYLQTPFTPLLNTAGVETVTYIFTNVLLLLSALYQTYKCSQVASHCPHSAQIFIIESFVTYVTISGLKRQRKNGKKEFLNLVAALLTAFGVG